VATEAGPDSVDPRSTERDSGDRRFERLERVRALRRSRRHRRVVLIATLVLVLAAGSVLGFTAVRRASSGNVGTTGAPAASTSREPVVLPAPAVSPAPAATRATSAPPAASPAPAVSPPPAAAPAPSTSPSTSPMPAASTPAVDTPSAPATPSAPVARTEGTNVSEVATTAERAKVEVVSPRRAQPEAPPAAGVAPSAGRGAAPRASVRSEPSSPEGGDPTAAIDWLLGTSRAKGE
jgi:hypothetical protein